MENLDSFEVIDGPEDGIEFSITRTPVDIGTDPSCGIFLRFDNAIKPVHARVAVVSGGYRIRSTSGAPIFINGKRSGMIWAKIVRSGGIVRVGATSLHLNCAPGGLASRSLGVPMESNIGWLLRMVFGGLWKTLVFTFRLLFTMPGKLTRFILPIVVAAIVIAWLKPGLFHSIYTWGQLWMQWLKYRLGAM